MKIAELEKELKKEREEKEKELKKEREEKAEMRRIIRRGLRFINEEKDWVSGDSSPKVSYRKAKVLAKSAGIDVDHTSEE